MKFIKKSLFLVLGLSVIFAQVDTSTAWFTSYVRVRTVSTLKRVIRATFDEIVEGYTKTLSVSNSGNSCHMYARCKIIYPRSYNIEVDTNDYWLFNDQNNYYYSGLIKPNTTTPPLKVNILNSDGSNIQPTSTDIDLNVIVVYEFIPAIHSPGGIPYADWDMTSNIVEVTK